MSYSQARPTTESIEKRKFRQTSVWKNFRCYMKKKSKKDFVTQKPLTKAFQLHHCDMHIENYKKLDEENFYTLNNFTHDVVHWLFRYKDWRGLLERLAVILEKMEELNPRKDIVEQPVLEF